MYSPGSLSLTDLVLDLDLDGVLVLDLDKDLDLDLELGILTGDLELWRLAEFKLSNPQQHKADREHVGKKNHFSENGKDMYENKNFNTNPQGKNNQQNCK